LLDDNVKAVLCDFGLSRLKADATSRTARATDGIVPGSRNWMSPERILGGALRKPADIYAFGMTIYEVIMHSVFYLYMKLTSLRYLCSCTQMKYHLDTLITPNSLNLSLEEMSDPSALMTLRCGIFLMTFGPLRKAAGRRILCTDPRAVRFVTRCHTLSLLHVPQSSLPPVLQQKRRLPCKNSYHDGTWMQSNLKSKLQVHL
jgi:serine/threonine protein kinase